MVYPKYLLTLLPFCALFSFVTSAPTVNTTTALITGCEVNFGDAKVNQFLGIPFAQPPVGDLRFRKTVPLEGWSGEIDATKYPPACSQCFPFQYDFIDTTLKQSEDCLYLNMWAPCDASPDNPKAVLFWLYAGSFTTGSNALPTYNGTVLAAKGDVIVVTPNYRVGIFGFLSTDCEEAPGNMGMYDVLVALKWVNTNIGKFGGDVNRITMAGNTAGSLTSVFLTTSPLAKGMFQNLIVESGANLTYRGDVKQYNLQLGQRVAAAVNCSSGCQTLQNNTKEVIDCLKSKPADVLIKAVNSFVSPSIISFLPIYGDEILPYNISEAYKKGYVQNVSAIIGSTRNEGTFQLISENFEVFGPYGEKEPVINKTYGTQLLDEVLKNDNIDSNGRRKIADYYFSKVSDTDYPRIRFQVARAIGDVNLFCNDYYLALLLSEKLKVFDYYFIHNDTYSRFARWVGATLFSEVRYVFGVPFYNDSKFTKEEVQLSGKMVELWSNFVKKGIPSPDWPRFMGSDPCPYVEILQVEGDDYDDPYQRFENCKFLRPFITAG